MNPLINRILVTGSAGHLGEALVRRMRELGYDVVGLDRRPSPFTTHVGSITTRSWLEDCLRGVDTVLHTATLHKPHVATHTPKDFVDTNITGTLNLLEESVRGGVERFVFTSTTSVFGDALVPPAGAPASWITEDVVAIPKNIYGVTKHAAEELCKLFHRNHGLACIVLRTSRFFPEEDDNRSIREAYADDNVKANEMLFRRVDIEDVVTAHLAAIERAPAIGFGKYIVSATTPFQRSDFAQLNADAPSVVQRYAPDYAAEYNRRGWRMFPRIDRVYVNERARTELGWTPRYDFAGVIARLQTDADVRSPLAVLVGSKGYHETRFADGPYPVHMVQTEARLAK